MMRPRPGASRAPDPSVSAPIAGLTYPPNPETQSTSGAEMFDGPPEAFQGGAFESPPQEAHLPFCRPLHISRVSLSLRYIMNLLHQDDFLTAETRFCAGKIIESKMMKIIRK